jgi:AAA family ATP:ADP antiporter
VNWRRDVRHGEGAALLLSALAFFLVLTAYYIIRPVRDQLSGATGSVSLPLFYAGTFVATLALTPVFGALVARVPRRRLLAWVYGFFIACLLAFVPAFMAQQQVGARTLGIVFFTWVSVFNLFVVSLFWSFMADVWSSLQARRLFPLIAFAGMLGALAGPPLTHWLVGVIGVALLLVVSATFLCASLAILLLLATRVQGTAGHGDAGAIGGSLWAGVRQALTLPFVRYMAVLMLLSDGIGTLAYALVADYAKAHFADSVARVAFYADLDLAINVFGAAMQLTVTRWLLVRFGAGWGLVVPALVNLALLAMIAVFGAVDVTVLGFGVSLLVVLQVVTRGTAYGMTKPASDALYTRIEREARYKGKNFVETAVWRFGDLAVTSGLNLLRGIGVGLTGIAVISAGLSAVAVWVGRRAGNSPDLAPDEAAGSDSRPHRPPTP